MVNITQFDIQIERIDDIPVVYGHLQKMGIQMIVDSVITPHGNWQGLTLGWVITIWLVHIITQHNHRMDCVQEWVEDRLSLLQRLTGQPITPLDFTDDRLALCLRDLSANNKWYPIEKQLGKHLIRVYNLNKEGLLPQIARLDATTAIVNHDPNNATLFKVGKAKNGLYATLFKMMIASLDPLGMPIAVDVVPGNRADEPQLLDELLKGKQGSEAEMELIFFPEDIPANGDKPDPNLAIARGFETERSHTAVVEGKSVTWTERLLAVRSFNYVQSMQDGLHRRLDKAEKALRDLTPTRQRGKRQIKDEESLLAAIEHIEKKYKVQALFTYDYEQEVSERKVRGYKGKPARIERKVRYQLTVSRQEQAIAQAESKAGWRIYVTNAPTEILSLAQAVLAYRDQYVAENVFRRLKGKILSITPLYIHRDDHAKGLFHLLTIAARVLALGDYVAKEALAQEKEDLIGVYAGNPKRRTSTPTMERMLQTFDNINLVILTLAEERKQFQITPLSQVQERILALLGLSTTLYTDLATT